MLENFSRKADTPGNSITVFLDGHSPWHKLVSRRPHSAKRFEKVITFEVREVVFVY